MARSMSGKAHGSWVEPPEEESQSLACSGSTTPRPHKTVAARREETQGLDQGNNLLRLDRAHLPI